MADTDKEYHPLVSKFVSFFYRYLGKDFFRFQKGLFFFYFGAILTDFLMKWIFGGREFPEFNILLILNQFLYATLRWLILATIISFVWWVLVKFACLDLWIYYYFWIPRIVPLLGKLKRFPQDKLELLELIKDSYSYEKKGGRPCPVFIKREHLNRKSFWPHWEFSLIVISQPGKIEINVAKSRSNPRFNRWVMVADLSNESYGIYNNAGKRFLRDKFKNEASKRVMRSLSESFYDVLSPTTELGTSLRWGEVSEILPLRWVSGGFLPIVDYREKEWVMFFFRDISPIGLNIALGGSESRSEYKNLHELMGREFSEETVLLMSEPRFGATIPQQKFTVEQFGIRTSEHISEYINPSFAQEHNALRKEHDNIKIEILDTDDGRPISTVRTPFRVRVKYHSSDLKKIDDKYIKNVIFTINPYEFSVEVIWLCKFNLEDGECLIDGEVDIGRNYLVRQPVILLSMDYLKSIFMDEGSLGSKIPGSDSKLLPHVPKEHFIVFEQDNVLRKKRLEFLDETLAPSTTFDENLIYEQKRIRKWLDNYDEVFTQVSQGNYTHEAIRTLCPVTWKTLEILFSHKINYKV